jgi:ribosomal protein L11 methyltransferase
MQTNTCARRQFPKSQASQRLRGKVVSDPGFIALRFDVEAAHGDAWSDALLEAGALSVDAADPRAGTEEEVPVFAERLDRALQWWPISRLTVLLGADADAGHVMSRAARLASHTVPAYETSVIPDQDWVRATQAQFQPIRIEDDLWIVPTWCTPPHAEAVNIMLDPGVAFGTGAHPTTRSCLSWLHEHAKSGASMLDYGCGSGILAIAAARLGMSRVVGTDIDPQALRAGAANAELNRVEVAFAPVDALPAGTFDIVIANILANPLRVLASVLAARTAAGGLIALAGILSAQAAAVTAAYAPWFDLKAWRSADGWVLLHGRRLPVR